jgi:glycosyltransferase involved in cell wall biosynthesis
MKIALDCRRIQPGMSGLGTYTLQIMSALAGETRNRNDELTAFITPESRRFISLPDTRINFIEIPWPVENHIRGDFWKHVTLPGLLHRLDIDVFHEPSYQLPLRQSRAAYVVTIHDLAPFRFPETNSVKYNLYWKFMTRAAVRRARRIIAVSDFTRSEILDMFPGAGERIEVVPEAAAACFVPGDVTDEKLMSFGITRPYVVTAAKYEPRKNLERCIRAFMQGPARCHSGVRLVVAGAMGWKNRNLEQLLREREIRDRIVLTGYLDQPALVDVIRGAEALIVPSIYEGFGLPVLEGMACGTPVICARAASLPEIGAEAALYFDPFDIESMAGVMTECLSDPELRMVLRSRGLKRAGSFSWARTAESTLEVYRRALET